MVRLCSAVLALGLAAPSNAARISLEGMADLTTSDGSDNEWFWRRRPTGDSCEDMDFSDVFRTTPAESGTVLGMRYAEILYGDCTSFHPDGSCETLETTFVSSHGVSDCQGWEHLTAANVAAQVVNAEGEHPRVVIFNGIRFFTMDEMVNGDSVLSSVRLFNAARVAQRVSGSLETATICGLKWAAGGQFQTRQLPPGELVLPSNGEAVEFDETEGGSWLLEPITNQVGTHCKNTNAGRLLWFLKVPVGCAASVSKDRYYFMQSNMDVHPVEPPPEQVNFNRWQEIPPFSGGGSDYAAMPRGYTMASITIPERLDACQDDLGNIYLIQDEYQGTWMEVVEPPQWLLDLEFPDPPAGPCE